MVFGHVWITISRKLVENFKIGLPEPKLEYGDPNSIISPP
jgi:hypothetical protein